MTEEEAHPAIPRRLVAMIEYDGKEPPANLPDRQAEATWAAVSCLWHPSLLARVEILPVVEGVEYAAVSEPNDLRLVAEGAGSRLDADYRETASSQGTILAEGEIDRLATARKVLTLLDPEAQFEHPADALVPDFFALGTARWWLRDLTIGMGHADCLDLDGLTREALAAAKSWASGDFPTAKNQLRAAFEMLSQARERFYPVDAYLVDLVLLDPGASAGALADSLEARAPFSIIAPARSIERMAEVDPDRIALLREAITEGWADVVGGTFSESDESLLPVASIFFQYRKATEIYRAHLDDRNVETLASRRFALYPMKPQVARRFGFRFAIHVGLDAGAFPIPPESKKLWEAPDASHLESITRPPIAADRPGEGVRLAWRMARSMQDDQVAAVAMVHWPSPVAGWYRDLRRVDSYAPVMARWVTTSDFFHRTDRPFDMFGSDLDEYKTPYLAQAVSRGDARPISGRAAHFRDRAKFDALVTLDALRRALTSPPKSLDEPPSPIPPAGPAMDAKACEEAIELGRSGAIIEDHEPSILAKLAEAIGGSGSAGPPGYLVFNPVGMARRVPVKLSQTTTAPPAEGPLKAVQARGESCVGVVDLPGFGFAWIPRDGRLPASARTGGSVSADGRTIRNESMEVEFDAASGGIRAIRARGEPSARLGQQLTIAGLNGPDGQPTPARMVGESVEIEASGPALSRISSRGSLLHPADGRTLARFRQVAQLWSGRPTLEIEITISDVDEEWRKSIVEGNPWDRFLSCRWAWPDPNSTLRRTSLLCPCPTEAVRPETPEAIEISSRLRRSAILFGGLAHHRRHGSRMLDTLLIAGREGDGTFRLGVTLDLEHASQAAIDFLAPAPLIATESGPPRVGPIGWLAHLDSKAVAVASVEFVDQTAEDRGWGLAFVLIETAGRPTRCRLRLFRDPIEARQTDFQGEVIMEIYPEGDAVPIDLTSHEMARIEVRLG